MKFRSILFALAAMVVAFASQANAGICDLTWHGKGGGVQDVVGFFEIKGEGTLHCLENGYSTDIPVDVKVGGKIFALRSAAGFFFAQGTATGLGYNKNPAELVGKYATEQNDAAAYVGAGTSYGLRAANGSLVGTFGVSAFEGLGWDIGFNTVRLSLNTKKPVKIDLH